MVFFSRKQPAEKTENVEYRQGIAVSWVSNKSPRVSTYSYAGEIQELFYGFDMARMLKGPLAELTLGGMVLEIPTYVRGDNSGAAYQVDSVNTVTNEKRPIGAPESNMGLDQNDWLGVCYIPGDMNTSGGLTKAMSSANMRHLLSDNTFRIVTEEKRRKLGKRRPCPNAI